MNISPLTGITAQRAQQTQFDGGRLDTAPDAMTRTTSVVAAPRDRAGLTAIRTNLATLLHRAARAVEPRTRPRPVTR